MFLLFRNFATENWNCMKQKENKEQKAHKQPWQERYATPEKIGQAFTRLGFEYRRTSAQRGYVAIRRMPAEMEAYRRTLAEEATKTVTDDSMTAKF